MEYRFCCNRRMSCYCEVATLRKDEFNLAACEASSGENGVETLSEESNAEESLISSPFSRRSLLKAGVIVGGTVWVAPVIDSFVSRAAAASGAPSFGCSWAYVVWKYSGSSTVYYTGWKGETNTTCATDSANPHSVSTVTCTDSGGSSNTYNLENPSGAPPPLNYSGTDIGSGTLSSTTDSVCADFTYSGLYGRTINAASNIEILAVFTFGGDTNSANCPNTSGAGNSVNIVCRGQTR